MHHVLVGHATNFCTALNYLRVQMIIYWLNVHCGHFLKTVPVWSSLAICSHILCLSWLHFTYSLYMFCIPLVSCL